MTDAGTGEIAIRRWARDRVFSSLVATLAEIPPSMIQLLASPLTFARWTERTRRAIETASGTPYEAAPAAFDRPPRIFVVAGERSGDRAAAELVEAIRARAPGATFEGLGGERMEAAGVTLLRRMDRLEVMGFIRVAGLAGTFAELMRETLVHLATTPPDALLLVDYPGFNLRLARAARSLRIPTIQYVAPQVWGWAPWRRPIVGKSVDRILALLPFEPEVLAGLRAETRFVGHPLPARIAAEGVAPWRADGDWIGLLPGSRTTEIDGALPTMLAVAERIAGPFPSARFVLALPHERARERVAARVAAARVPVEVVVDQTSAVMASLRTAIVTSGTATLELACHRVPMVVVYPIWPLIGRLVTKVLVISPWIALANVAAGREVVPERLIRGKPHEIAEIARTAGELHADGPRRDACLDGLAAVDRRLASEGAIDRAARAVLELAQEPPRRAAGRLQST